MEDPVKNDYYDKIIKIIEDYLGPAADRFVNRQVTLHIKKNPHDLQKDDVQMLAIRIRSGMLVLTHDETVVEEAFRRLTAVADK